MRVGMARDGALGGDETRRSPPIREAGGGAYEQLPATVSGWSGASTRGGVGAIGGDSGAATTSGEGGGTVMTGGGSGCGGAEAHEQSAAASRNRVGSARPGIEARLPERAARCAGSGRCPDRLAVALDASWRDRVELELARHEACEGCAHQRREPEDPELRRRPTADEERRAGGATGVDREVVHRDADAVCTRSRPRIAFRCSAPRIILPPPMSAPPAKATLRSFLALDLLDNRYPALHGLRVLAIVTVVQFHITWIFFGE